MAREHQGKARVPNEDVSVASSRKMDGTEELQALSFLHAIQPRALSRASGGP
eukprot:CAMPEP_0169081472 /NCGR_PEP_ID=MMETSP1015-20121227/11029_1 /TAXON_ID=342587 /ORGANISM="Karlodinium micrum, Strain CCMP2283" /LENGTH=51 /DNA_ID=CAMNT_0009141263 /DNA_START=367 /DNA_END=522 /DNA_ORIENTATION=-